MQILRARLSARTRSGLSQVLERLADACLALADRVDPSRRERILAGILQRIEDEGDTEAPEPEAAAPTTICCGRTNGLLIHDPSTGQILGDLEPWLPPAPAVIGKSVGLH